VAHYFNEFHVVDHTAQIWGGAHVGMLRVGYGQGLAIGTKAGDGGGAAGHGGQSEASAECCTKFGVRESEAAGGCDGYSPRLYWAVCKDV
jgi:hypothetical protein